MDDFFATIDERWPAGREDYHWHVLPGSEMLRDRILRPYLPITEQPGLVPVRPEFLHVTIQHLAAVSEISATELDRIVWLVRDRCANIAPFVVTPSRAEAWEHGIVCPIRPGYLPASLWRIACSAYKEATGGRFPILPAVFHPHLSMAYATGQVESDPIRAWLADCDAPEFALPVTKLVLVAQQHNRREITFRTVDEVPLAG